MPNPVYTNLLDIQGASIRIQTFFFFVQAFKIVVDSWKFSMLLLYILQGSLNKFPYFFRMGTFIDITHMKL